MYTRTDVPVYGMPAWRCVFYAQKGIKKGHKDRRYLCWYMGLPFNAHTSDEVMPLRDDNKRGIQVTEDKQKANTIVTAYASNGL